MYVHHKYQHAMTRGEQLLKHENIIPIRRLLGNYIYAESNYFKHENIILIGRLLGNYIYIQESAAHIVEYKEYHCTFRKRYIVSLYSKK